MTDKIMEKNLQIMFYFSLKNGILERIGSPTPMVSITLIANEIQWHTNSLRVEVNPISSTISYE